MGRNAALLLCACALVAGCGQKHLTEASVRKFVDAADEAFTKGSADLICRARSDDFILTVTEFDLAPNRIVADFAQARRIAAEREAAHEVITGKTETFTVRDICFTAFQSRGQFKRTKLQRGPLQITIDPDGKRAIVRAHYTTWEPVSVRDSSPLGYQDSIEHQIATKQSESDDESVIVLANDGKPKFASTTAVTQWFRIPSQRDSRL
jgi:hypothetical protein